MNQLQPVTQLFTLAPIQQGSRLREPEFSCVQQTVDFIHNVLQKLQSRDQHETHCGSINASQQQPIVTLPSLWFKRQLLPQYPDTRTKMS